MCLLEHPDLVVMGENDFDLESLLKFPWDDAQSSANLCRETAQRLADAIQVPLPSIPGTGAAGKNSAKAKSPRDDFASYASLVDSAS